MTAQWPHYELERDSTGTIVAWIVWSGYLDGPIRIAVDPAQIDGSGTPDARLIGR